MNREGLRKIIKEEMQKGPFKPEIEEAGKSQLASFDFSLVNSRAKSLHVLLGKNQGNKLKLNKAIYDALKKYSSLSPRDDK